MISDEIGLRFLNNYWVAGKLLSMISIQKYNFDLLLPFQIKIDMILDRTKINNVDIDILNLKIFLSQWLIDNQTGTKISFYKSHIHQLIHDYAPWVKSCYLTLFDNTGFEIPNSNFESYPIKTLIDTLPKEDVLDFTPIYYWFDVDNIGIDYSFTS
jgi:hypothetical protein